MRSTLALAAAISSVLMTASAQSPVSGQAAGPILIPYTATGQPFQISLPPVTNLAQLSSEAAAVASAANAYFTSVRAEPEYSAYLSVLGPSLSSALQAATTNEALALSVGSYSAPADFFSTIPTSARNFYSSVWSRESQVIASAAQVYGGALITPAASTSPNAASTTATPRPTNTASSGGSAVSGPALWGMAVAVGGLVAGVAAL